MLSGSLKTKASSYRRCTVTGRHHGDGMPMSLVCEARAGGDVVLYPHGIGGNGVVLDSDQQRELGRWLIERPAKPRLPEPQD